MKPWLLKSPTNFGCEDQLVRTMGSEIKIICPHRDPAKIVASIARVCEYYRSLFSDVDQKQLSEQLGQSMLGLFSMCAQRHMEWRRANSEISILDLSYQEVTGDTDATLSRIYDFLDVELTDDIVDLVRVGRKTNVVIAIRQMNTARLSLA